MSIEEKPQEINEEELAHLSPPLPETPQERFREVITPRKKKETSQIGDIKVNAKKHSKALNTVLAEIITTFILVSVFALKDGMPMWSWLLLLVTLISSKLVAYVRILLTGEVQDAKDEAKDKELKWKDREIELLTERNDLKKDLERVRDVAEFKLKKSVYEAVILSGEWKSSNDALLTEMNSRMKD